MGSEHKKAMLFIFSLVFICMLAGSLFLTVMVEHYTTGLIVCLITAIIALDIRWVMKFDTSTESVNT